MTRILHVGLGPLGRRIVGDFAARRMGDIAGAVDIAPELSGKSLREVLPGAGDSLVAGARVVASLDEVDSWDPIECVIVTTRSSLESCRDTFTYLLERGMSVVSSCEELLFPWLRHKNLATELHQLAVSKRARLLGTGVNPGLLMDTLPLIASAACNDLDSLEIYRIQDASSRRVPFQTKIGATLDVAGFQAAVAADTVRHVGLGESLHFVAHYLGMAITRWEETLDPVIAQRDLQCDKGPIARGLVSGVRQVAIGWEGEKQVLKLVFQAAIGQQDPHDRVVIHGDPPIDLVIRGGVHGDTATSAILLNSIESLRAAEYGLHTMATIRPVHWRRR